MKQTFFSLTTIGLLGLALLTSCFIFDLTASVDLTAPIITLIGDASISIYSGDTYTDPGANAIDDIDGVVSSAIVVGGDTVDTDTPGTYTITYNVSDSAGNAAIEVTREVIVLAPLKIVPISATIQVGAEIDFSASGGTPPYLYLIVSGSGTIDTTTGRYLAPSSASLELIRVVDDAGKKSEALIVVIE